MFSPEQLRHLENLRMAYDTWLAAARAGRVCGPRMVWKTVSGRDYLYEITSRSNNGRSMGPRSADTERLFEARRDCRADAEARLAAITPRLDELAAMHKALRLPRAEARFGRVLREFDLSGLLGQQLLVVGTNAMLAYELEAQTRFAEGYDATLDADFTWRDSANTAQVVLVKNGSSSQTPVITAALKRIDALYTINSEKPFQARDAKGYAVEILVAPSLAASYPKAEPLRPVALPEQEWLLLGRPIEAVTVDLRGRAVRLVVPDPRWMALHKAWLAEKPGRARNKVEKDRVQSVRLAEAIRLHMPHYPVDEAFRAAVPVELQPHRQALFP